MGVDLLKEKVANFTNLLLIFTLLLNFSMKKYIHPKWYTKVPVLFENNIIYITGSTSSSLSIEILAKVHPAYQKNLDKKISNPTDKFNKKYKKNLLNK